jgi:hypothetical protein
VWKRWWSDRRSRRRLLLGATLAVVSVAALLVIRLFVSPRSVDPHPADAVVALGDDPTRIGRAVELMGHGIAPRLVLPLAAGQSAADTTVAALCGGSAGYEVVCPEVDASGLRGGMVRAEARVGGELAAAGGWHSVAVVAGPAQLSRASLVVERCAKAAVGPVTVQPVASKGVADGRATRIRDELYPYLRALVFDREC